jgi:hypothetical protein
MLLTMVRDRSSVTDLKQLSPRRLGARFYTQKYTFFRVHK